MCRSKRYILAALVVLLSLVFVPGAAAHPLGNFTINHYAGLNITPGEIKIDYVLDMAEIPAYQEIAALDANQNGQPDADETASYPAETCEAIRSNLSLTVDGQVQPLSLSSSAVEFPPGQGGLATLRLTCAFQAKPPALMDHTQLEFKDDSYAQRLGWREIVVTSDRVTLQGEYTSTSLSRRLTAYPQDLLASPLDQRHVSFDVILGSEAAGTPGMTASLPATQAAGTRNDAFTRLILLEDLNLPTLLFALAISFVWGAMHAMTPGHGKTIVGAYLVGSRGTIRHALYLGLATTITHTAGVFALGMATLFAAQFILPEQLFPWLSLFSGLLVVAIGVNLFISRLRLALLSRISPPPASMAGEHSHAAQPHYEIQPGLPRADLIKTHHHDHSSYSHSHSHPGDRAHSHEHNQDHTHAGHSHLPPGADGTPVTWRSLLALGVSGGLLPCPSALVVLLSAIALDRIGFGLLLVLAFSLGLAGVLTAIGMLFVYAGRFFERIPARGPLLRVLPALSALFIALVGLGIAARALVEMGIIQL